MSSNLTKGKKTVEILHVITGLETGGAQVMLSKLVSHMDGSQFKNRVVSLAGKDPSGKEIEACGIEVVDLGMRRGVPNPLGVWKLRNLICRTRPDIVQTWLYHADLVGALAAKLAGDFPVAWNIRNSNLEPGKSKRMTILTAMTCAKLSGMLADHIICCSEISAKIHEVLGYQRQKMRVIPNGFDPDKFKPDHALRKSLRGELGIGLETLLIGMPARFDPQKDHYNLVRAASRLLQEGRDIMFLLCGEGVDWNNKVLRSWIEDAGLKKNFFLLGLRNDMRRVMAALDVLAFSSAYGEAFPQVIGEAMACGVPCVATDVGDSAYIVGDTGRIVPPEDPAALAKALGTLAFMGREARLSLGKAARERIKERFDLSKVVRRYEDFYLKIGA